MLAVQTGLTGRTFGVGQDRTGQDRTGRGRTVLQLEVGAGMELSSDPEVCGGAAV